MNIPLYSQSGEKVGEIALSKNIFEVNAPHALITKALLAQNANERRPIAHTKTRAEVSGSTKKLTPQKGRGRSRIGQDTSPVRKGGGVAFGPRSHTRFDVSLPKQERRKALLSLLSLKAQGASILGLDSYEGEVSTKKVVALLSKMDLIDRKILIVLDVKNPVLEKSARNLENVKTILASYLNVRDILHSEVVIVMKDALPVIEKTFLPAL